MNSKLQKSISKRGTASVLVALAASCLPVAAGPSAKDASGGVRERGVETNRDLPGSFHRYYGQRVNYYKDTERRIAKLDLDADLNYDGKIDNSDPSDGGAFEQTPPGLVVGVNEMSKMVLRLTPYRVDFRGEAVVTLEVSGINRGDKSGEFESFEDEQATVGHVKIWRDAARTELLVDSRDPARRYHEWVLDDAKYPANIPGIVPRTFYVEGAGASGAYLGDVRVLVTVSHRDRGTSSETYAESRKKLFKRFRTSFDHILVTVNSSPQHKEFINANSDKVWVTPVDTPSEK